MYARLHSSCLYFGPFNSPQYKRGQRSKQRRIRTRYKDQDEEERALRMALAGARPLTDVLGLTGAADSGGGGEGEGEEGADGSRQPAGTGVPSSFYGGPIEGLYL